MKNAIKNILKRNDKIYYLALCASKIKDEKFREKVSQIGKELTTVEIEKGHGYENDLLYVIEVGSSTIGLFALLRIVLNALAFADYYGLKPVVLFKDCVSYKEKDMINGSLNPFEYYFQQTTALGEDARSAINKRVSFLKCMESHYSKIFDLYSLRDIEGYLLENEHYEFYAKIVKKYLHYNNAVKKQLENDISAIQSTNKMIGVHYRGTDFNNNYGSHPVSIGVDDYIKAIKELPKEYNDYDIFLATDDNRALQCFIREFGSRIHYFHDVKRADQNLSVICSEDSRTHHKYLLGYEVIRDVEVLSRMNVLVAGLSQVATFARIIKVSRASKYEYDKLMSKGVNHNNRSHVTDMNIARKKK